jgi:hypothetical protein
MKRVPTRRDLLVVIGRLQNLIGLARAVKNDRNPERERDTNAALDEAHQLCIEARSFDPPIVAHKGPWGES